MSAQIFISYRDWLKSKSYSDATIRNYLVDLKKYFFFSNSDPNQVTDKIFDQNNLTSYFQNINQDQNYKRFLASLSKFFQFALDQQLISENPFPKALKIQPETNLEEVVNQYQEQLVAKKFSLSTIKNYINDVQQYINWIKSTPNQNPPAPINIGAPSLDKGWLSKIKIKFPFFQGGMSRRDKGVSIEN